jgi:hypothetical protein
MRTIQQVVTVTPDNQLIIQLPVDISPGKHKVVLVIDEQACDEALSIATPDPSVLQNKAIFKLGENPVIDTISDASEQHDFYIYDTAVHGSER